MGSIGNVNTMYRTTDDVVTNQIYLLRHQPSTCSRRRRRRRRRRIVFRNDDKKKDGVQLLTMNSHVVVKGMLLLFCIYAVSNPRKIEKINHWSCYYFVSAFSTLRPRAMPLKSYYAVSEKPFPRTATTSLFLFSTKNEDEDEDDDDISNKEGPTATTVKRKITDRDKEDFSAWMEGISKGTPLSSLLSSSSSTSFSSPSQSTSSSTRKNVKTATITKDPKIASSITTSSNNEASNSETTRRRINPLSNLIQFEAMLELAKIAGTKEFNNIINSNSNNQTKNSDASNNSDIFSTVDRVLKTFQKQEAEQQKERKEFLQLSQHEEKIGADDNDSEDDIDTTTVEDLMVLEQYVGGIPFQMEKLKFWETFSNTSAGLSIIDVVDKKESNLEDNDDAIKTSSSPVEKEKYDITFVDSKSIGKKKDSTSDLLAQAAETVMKDTTARIEFLVAEASSVFVFPYGSNSNNSIVEDIVVRASSGINNTNTSTSTIEGIITVATTGTTVESISDKLVAAAQKIAKESGVDINVQFAAEKAKEATEFAVDVAATANMVLGSGYAYGSRSDVTGMEGRDDYSNYLAAQTAGSALLSPQTGLSSTTSLDSPHQPPLFGNFSTARRVEPYEYDNVVFKGAEMGGLAGAIYEEDTVSSCHKLGHSLVANGTTANVVWMVTDAVMDIDQHTSAYRHHGDDDSTIDTSSSVAMIRTITIRGFDASDESVDREAVLNDICTATPEPMDDATTNKVVFHKGLLSIARQIYADTKIYIDWMSPNHRIILNGHSVGGSLSILMLLLITNERGVDYVLDRIFRVYSHGSPPVAFMNTTIVKSEDENIECVNQPHH